jgi:spore coat polysaccharide biosynthesis protein SpsF
MRPWLAARPEVALHVHTGPAFRFDAELDAELNVLTNACWRHRRVDNMAALMAKMDLAVCAAGMMACELATVGVPSILVTAENKELETAEAFVQKGMAVSLGAYAEGTGGDLRGALECMTADLSLRQDLSRAARRNVDGDGARRILSTIDGLMR